MNQLLTATLNFLIVWGIPVAAGVLVLAFALDRRLSRGHHRGWPPSWPARVGKILLTVVNGAAVSWLVMVLFVSAPRDLASGARRIDGFMGRQTPDLVFRLVESDQEMRLHQFQDKVVLLNLWATWCPPCVEELPTLGRLEEVYGAQGLVVVTLSQQGREELLAFSRKRPTTAISGYAQDLGWLDVGDARPFTLVLDRQGELRDFAYGRHDLAGFERMVRPYL